MAILKNGYQGFLFIITNKLTIIMKASDFEWLCVVFRDSTCKCFAENIYLAKNWKGILNNYNDIDIII